MKVDDRRAHGPNPRHVRDALPRRPKSRRPVFSPDRASAHRAAPARRGARVSNDSFTVLVLSWTSSRRWRPGREGPVLEGRPSDGPDGARHHVTTLDSRYGHANAAAAAGPVSLAHASRSGRRAGQLAP